MLTYPPTPPGSISRARQCVCFFSGDVMLMHRLRLRLSYRLLYVTRRPLPRRRRRMLPLPLPDPVLEIVAAGGFVARDPVPLLPHAGASVLPVFAGVEAAEVPHNQRLHQQHREGCYQGGPRPAGQPASTQAANHLRTRLHGAGGPSVAVRSATGGRSGSRGRTTRRRRWWWW